MTFFSEYDDYRERSLNIQMSQVNVDKRYKVSIFGILWPTSNRTKVPSIVIT